ncbi:ribokinase [Pseudolysinimonas yzui]|uniref:Ribokinase n=1 Tax=Pseudolysinimonas yzui TaxID=2708254 RepID=A0A8J3GSF8_9MICO|nr:ribokinase [Pseudolysinimonas yzui]GHF23645.1 ribokinase [Pseudolysinimonas yzui]
MVRGPELRVAVAGGYGVGLTMQLPRFPQPGETVTDGVLSSGHGGKGSNQAVGAARLGAEVSLLSAVGSDAAGTDAVAMWAVEGVDAGAVLRAAEATMTGFILVDAAGENCIAIAPGALGSLQNAHAEAFRSRIAGADIVLVSLEIPLAVAVRVLEIAAEEGVPTILNPAPAPGALPASVWRHVTYLTPNRSEALALLGGPPRSTPELAADLARLTGGIVILTLGDEGAIVASAADQVAIDPVPAAAVVDTTGAGDAFNAALAVALAAGVEPVAAARWAAQAGSYSVAHAGALPGLPRRADLGELPHAGPTP